MAIEAIKDFDRLDLADSTIILLELEIVSYKSQMKLQERLALGLEQQIKYLKEVNDNNAEMLVLSSEEVEYWEKQYRKQKRQKFLVGGTGLLLTILALMAN